MEKETYIWEDNSEYCEQCQDEFGFSWVVKSDDDFHCICASETDADMITKALNFYAKNGPKEATADAGSSPA